MVLEIAQITAQPGKAEELQAGLAAALSVIRGAEGCHSATVRRQVEDPAIFILMVDWETLEHHTVMFRGGPRFAEYRSHIAGLFVDPIVARHYEQVAG